jgi:hypothetical protein
MAGDIFGYKRDGKPQGVFSTTGSKMNMSGGGEAKGYLVQNWNTNYRQDVREIFEIGSDNLYWAKGRPTGTGEIGRIVGAKDAIATGGFFPDKAYDLCDGGVQVTLSAKGGSCDKAPSAGQTLDKGVKIKMDGVVVSSIGFSMQVSQDIQLNESFGWRFAWMQIESF